MYEVRNTKCLTIIWRPVGTHCVQLNNIECWRSQGPAEKSAVVETVLCRGGGRVVEVVEVTAVWTVPLQWRQVVRRRRPKLKTPPVILTGRDWTMLIPEGCCSRCSRQSAGCPPCPPPSPSPGLSGRRHYPRWPHCSPGPASSEYFLSKVITILAREYWERLRWRKKERFSLISSSMEKKPENCLSKQEAGRFNLKFCFEQMSGRRKSWRSFIIIFFCKSDLTCPL